MSIDITEIKKSIHSISNKWNNLDKIYYTQAVQNTTFPYAVYYFITDVENGSDTKDKYYDIKLQINVYSVKNDNGDEVESILSEIETSLTSLTVSGFTVVKVRRDFKTPAFFKDKVWGGVLSFNIHIK